MEHTGGWNQGTLKGPRGLEMTSIAIESEYFHICKLYVSKYMFGCFWPKMKIYVVLRGNERHNSYQ